MHCIFQSLFKVLVNPLARGNVAQQNPWIIPPPVSVNGNSSHSGELSGSCDWPTPLSAEQRRSFFRSTVVFHWMIPILNYPIRSIKNPKAAGKIKKKEIETAQVANS